jgi:hypothetical protein
MGEWHGDSDQNNVPDRDYEPVAFCAWHIKDKTRIWAYTTGGEMCKMASVGLGDVAKTIKKTSGPEVARLYCQHYGGVDRSDQMLAEYQPDHRHTRRSAALFSHLVMTCATCAFVLMRDWGVWKHGHLKFNRQLALSLLALAPKRRTRDANGVSLPSKKMQIN